MLPSDELAIAIDVHARSYRLLRWLAGAMAKGFIPVRRAHDHTEAADSAREWIEEHYLNIPPDSRPQPEHLEQFANFFGTYLTTSFDIIEQPGSVRVTECGCYCPMCSYLVQAPHLRVKRVTSSDKKIANNRMIDRIEALAVEEALPMLPAIAEHVAKAEETRRSVAYSTYGYWLIERMRGHTPGTAILALWREIAWNKSGSPIPRFQLRMRDVEEAELLLVNNLRVELK